MNRNTIFIKFDNAYSSKNLYRSSYFIHLRMLEVLIVVVGNSLCVESKEKDTQIFSLYLPSFHVKGMPHKRHHQHVSSLVYTSLLAVYTTYSTRCSRWQYTCLQKLQDKTCVCGCETGLCCSASLYKSTQHVGDSEEVRENFVLQHESLVFY